MQIKVRYKGKKYLAKDMDEAFDFCEAAGIDPDRSIIISMPAKEVLNVRA